MIAHKLIDQFEAYLREGKTHAEAKSLLSRSDIHEAMEELGTPDGRMLLDLLARASFEESESLDLDQAMELWAAGWKSESVTPNSQVMSWYWRSPPKRKGSKGRQYLSTNQAWMAFRRSHGLPIEGRR